MITLALDLATHTGWALRTRDRVLWGTWALSPDGPPTQRVRALEQRLTALHSRHHIERVVYENVMRHAGSNAAKVYFALLNAVERWSEDHYCTIKSYPVKSIKKFATGNGNASKEQMIQAALAQRWRVDNDNEADALWLLALATD